MNYYNISKTRLKPTAEENYLVNAHCNLLNISNSCVCVLQWSINWNNNLLPTADFGAKSEYYLNKKLTYNIRAAKFVEKKFPMKYLCSHVWFEHHQNCSNYDDYQKIS